MAHGRYTIVGKLADGGMAEIFLAVQHGAQGFTKPVVLKRVLAAFSADPQFRNMFLDEAHISMTLAHGNIVQVLDVGVSGERTFLVLELVEGWDLERILERAQATGADHPWPPSLALYVTAQVCRALAYAHAKRGRDGVPLGIVHRDVSPNNVLISEQGEVKLADFGIAKAERKREQTLAGVIKGKIGFMSPEQALGQPLDARADLFSLGTVMYLMLTGRRPFEAGTELESLLRAQKADYRPPEQLNPYLSPEATAVVNRAMRADAAARYQTAEEMLIDVERVLRAEYHSAGQTELKVWLGELARRDGAIPVSRAAAAAAAAVEDDAARPAFVDVAGELSAGASVELSDLDGAGAATLAPSRVATPVAGGPRATPVRSPGSPSAENAGANPGRVVTPTAVAPTQVGPVWPPTEQPESRAGAGAVEAIAPTVDVVGRPALAMAPRRIRRGRVGLGFALGALCMLAAVFAIRWLAEWAGRERGGVHVARSTAGVGLGRAGDETPARSAVAVATDNGPGTRPAPATADGAGSGDAAAASSHAATAVAAAGARDAGASGELPAAASAHDGQPAGSLVATKESDDEEEARLLGHIRPDTAAVIGEDEAEESSARAGATANQAGRKSEGALRSAATSSEPRGGRAEAGRDAGGSKPRSRAAAAAAAARASPVQVRITSSPLGAVVRTKKQVLGRTPLAIRFNPGSTYELTFVKSGYLSNSRRLAVASGKPQSISVALKKAPPASHRRFFLR